MEIDRMYCRIHRSNMKVRTHKERRPLVRTRTQYYPVAVHREKVFPPRLRFAFALDFHSDHCDASEDFLKAKNIRIGLPAVLSSRVLNISELPLHSSRTTPM